jgi:hypothetical protein
MKQANTNLDKNQPKPDRMIVLKRSISRGDVSIPGGTPIPAYYDGVFVWAVISQLPPVRVANANIDHTILNPTEKDFQ